MFLTSLKNRLTKNPTWKFLLFFLLAFFFLFKETLKKKLPRKFNYKFAFNNWWGGKFILQKIVHLYNWHSINCPVVWVIFNLRLCYISLTFILFRKCFLLNFLCINIETFLIFIVVAYNLLLLLLLPYHH